MVKKGCGFSHANRASKEEIVTKPGIILRVKNENNNDEEKTIDNDDHEQSTEDSDMNHVCLLYTSPSPRDS